MKFVLQVFALLFLLVGPLWAQQDYELSYLLVRTSDGQVLAAQEEDKLRTPASTMKVVTAAAALQVLGPDHRYSTTVWTDAKIQRGRLRGDLALKGDADPELTLQGLDDLATQLHTAGIRHLEGDLLVDDGPNADPPYGVGWAWDDAGEGYSPEITGLAIDGGVVDIEPGFQAPWLRLEPSEQSSLRLIPGREGVQVRGELPASIAPPRSSLRTGEIFRQRLQRRGIELRGKVEMGRAKGREIASHQSRPLWQILEQALSVSDNLAMELVYRSTGMVLPDPLEGQRLRRADGSGLSRYNLISARQLTAVLIGEKRLRDILPTSGQGTLGKRFLEGPAAGQIRAKTGTLSSISALTGYLFPGRPEECVFAILVNGHIDSNADRKAIENVLVEGWARDLAAPAP